MRAILLVGSPRGERSTSWSLGHYLMDQLRERGWEAEEVHLHKRMGDPEGEAATIEKAAASDLIVLSFPTYVDSTPAAVVRAMEALAGRMGDGRRPALVAIANCGFPEGFHNDTALEICRLFARDAGLRWMGALSLGGGPAIDGRPLAASGGRGRNARRSLELAAGALANGEAVPEEAVKAMAKGGTPRWLYILFGNMGWRKQAGRHGVADRLEDRPLMKGRK